MTCVLTRLTEWKRTQSIGSSNVRGNGELSLSFSTSYEGTTRIANLEQVPT